MALARTAALVATLSLISAGVGWLVGSYFFDDWLTGPLALLALAGIVNVAAFLLSDKTVPRSCRARILKEEENPTLSRIARKLSTTFGLPMPRVALIPSRTPNAMATRRRVPPRGRRRDPRHPGPPR